MILSEDGGDVFGVGWDEDGVDAEIEIIEMIKIIQGEIPDLWGTK